MGILNIFSRGLWSPTSNRDLVDSEKELLKGMKNVQTRDVIIDEVTGDYLHTIEIGVDAVDGDASTQEMDGAASSQPSARHSRAPLVIWPGFGMGGAGFGLSFPALSQKIGCERRVFTVDWLGYGLSSRPSWNAKTVPEAESWFVEALEKWRAINGIDKMVLMGHSMGGYLSVAYSERYPERVEHLILLSPCGLPKPPSAHEVAERRRNLPLRTRVVRSCFLSLWNTGASPQQAMRTLGPLGRAQVLHYPHRRFYENNQWTDSYTKEKLGEYLYHMAAAPGSGEHMLTTLMLPGAFAKAPLVERIPKLKVNHISFIYGKSDWMDCNAAEDAMRIIKGEDCVDNPTQVAKEAHGASEQPAVKASPTDRDTNSDNGRLRVLKDKAFIVEKAGHQLYLDNPLAFVDAVVTSLNQPNIVRT
ncbi:hypothetical protein CYMTET_8461 [Cymbomonas tetramitiformis]|uniref:AB hydrolase-1 domain-containing protein n=1 Tax=Cymbomonas tetramitiformis TaxID=36881 RepID=A0AAE0LGH1_9CHLO|nr:hypothetical protein CYMTET_8461 [Cymbomonas tetramitiformis]|eukprot:gene27598-34054_t